MVVDGVVDTTSVVVDTISGAGVVFGGGFLQENSLIRSKTFEININILSRFDAAFTMKSRGAHIITFAVKCYVPDVYYSSVLIGYL